MHPILKKHLPFLVFFVFFPVSLFSQIYNTEVEAIIELKEENEMLEVTGIAYNKTDVNQSLRYVLSVIRSNPQNSNTSKNDQSGRIVLEPNQRQNLSTTSINANEEDRVILLLLIYNIDDEIIGQDRIVINDNVSDEEVKQNFQEKIEETVYKEDVDTESEDGLTLRGIVIEETKTKPGRDFYKMFYTAYNSNNINGEKIVKIKEVMALGTNTKLEIYVGDDKVVEFFLRPKQDFLKAMSDASIRRVAMHFERLKRDANIIKRY
tara:strand:- start:37580 stop:38371 length:792 start_codon:yes stop_codon:yes gene_type:complete